MRRLLLCLLSLSLSWSSSLAQKQDELAGFGIETNVMVGQIIRHSQNFKGPLPAKPALTYEVNLIRQTDGRKDWEQRRNYPLWGFSFAYTDYGLDSVYGKAISFCPSLQLSIVRGENFEWTARIAAGGSIATRRYSRTPDWDTLNNAIGGRFNNFTIFTTDLRYHLNNHWDAQAGIDFTHMSNATMRTPNLGINRYGAHVGVRYFPATSRPEKIDLERPTLRNRWLAQARLGLALTQSGTADGPVYPVYLASVFASKRYHSQNKIFAGVDYSYHEKVFAFLRNNEIFPGEEKQHSWKAAVFAGHEWLLGRGSIVLQMGYYLRESALPLAAYYQKLGGQYYLLRDERGFIKELSVYGMLKTHLSQAELAEFGLGFGI